MVNNISSSMPFMRNVTKTMPNLNDKESEILDALREKISSQFGVPVKINHGTQGDSGLTVAFTGFVGGSFNGETRAEAFLITPAMLAEMAKSEERHSYWMDWIQETAVRQQEAGMVFPSGNRQNELSNAKEPEVHILDRVAKSHFGCKSYRLFLERGSPEWNFSMTAGRLAKIHDKLGLDWQPPEFINGHTEFEPYMELYKLFNTFTFNVPLTPLFTAGLQMFTSDFVGSRLVLHCTFAQMDASAYRLATILADARYRLSTDGLAEKLASANLPDGIDRDLLLETLSRSATEGLNKAEEFVESTIKSEAKVFAKRKFNILVDYDSRSTYSEEFQAKFVPFQKSVEQLLRQNIQTAGNVINEMGISKFAEFFSVNIVPAKMVTALQVENFLKELPPLDSPVTFDLFGNEFTRDGLTQRIEQIKRLLDPIRPFSFLRN
ncbi:MAG: hypothetical protein FWF79_01990 [Defluviitaleaceae bacterium]|nr:hypothetical protein [Defluviitaleaceae bacterium]